MFNLSFEELLEKYIESDMLIFPSLYEGFGMPILEAQTVGRVVVTSNVTSMPWVSGGGACLVDPFSISSIREGILRVIREPYYRESLIENGLRNIKRFDPDLISNSYLNLINKIKRENSCVE